MQVLENDVASNMFYFNLSEDYILVLSMPLKFSNKIILLVIQ